MTVTVPSSPQFANEALKTGAVYIIELCSGELRRWRYLGLTAPFQVSWCDEESGLVFSEASLMYAWRIVREDE